MSQCVVGKRYKNFQCHGIFDGGSSPPNLCIQNYSSEGTRTLVIVGEEMRYRCIWIASFDLCTPKHAASCLKFLNK